MKVLVIGATGGTGRAAVAELLAQGHHVTAFARHPERVGAASERLSLEAGDALTASDVERAVVGKDAVVVTLGISENPLRVRFFGPKHTPLDVRSAGTRNAITAMRRHGVRRLVVLSSYGVAETRSKLKFADKMFFDLILKPQIADTEKQYREVSESGLDWVLVQPVHLTDGPEADVPFASTSGATERLSVSRRSVAHFLAWAVVQPEYVRRSVSLSGRKLGVSESQSAKPAEGLESAGARGNGRALRSSVGRLARSAERAF